MAENDFFRCVHASLSGRIVRPELVLKLQQRSLFIRKQIAPAFGGCPLQVYKCGERMATTLVRTQPGNWLLQILLHAIW